mgnify:CR=1 FL=1
MVLGRREGDSCVVATSLADWLSKTWFDHMLAEDAGLNALKKHYEEKAKSV